MENVTAKYIGTIAHKILQLIAEHGISWWTNNANQQAEYMNRQLIQIGMPLDQMNHACDTLQTIIQNTLNDERGRWILHTHQDAKSEWAITAMINNEPKPLVIDRTFIDEQGTRWIIDYKTTTFSHDDLNAFLDKEQAKYLEKMETTTTPCNSSTTARSRWAYISLRCLRGKRFYKPCRFAYFI